MNLPFQAPVIDWDWGVVEEVVPRSEGQYLEYKEKLHADDDDDAEEWQIGLERELCAFANASGGVVIFGVSDDGTISSFEPPEHEVKQSIARLIQNTTPLVRTEISPKIETPSDKTDRILLAVEVEEATRKPVRCSDGSIYVRVNDRKEPMSREQMESLFIESDRKQQTIRQLEMEIERFKDVVNQAQPNITRIHGATPPDFHVLNTEGIREVLRDADHLYGDDEIREAVSDVLLWIRKIEHQEVMFGRAAKGYIDNHHDSQERYYQEERREFKKKLSMLSHHLGELAELADLEVTAPEID